MGTTVPHLRRVRPENRIPYVKLGGKLRFRRADLVGFIDAHSHTVAATRLRGWADDASNPPPGSSIRCRTCPGVMAVAVVATGREAGQAEGDLGCGKSSIAIDLAARLTSGSPMPAGEWVDPKGW